MRLNSMNCLSSSSERESADFTFFSPSSITREGKQNKTHNLSLCFSWSKQGQFKSNLEPTMKHLQVWLCMVSLLKKSWPCSFAESFNKKADWSERNRYINVISFDTIWHSAFLHKFFETVFYIWPKRQPSKWSGRCRSEFAVISGQEFSTWGSVAGQPRTEFRRGGDH